MCRSAAQGGRRCPGSTRPITGAPSPAATAGTTTDTSGATAVPAPTPAAPASRPAASYAAAEAELDNARTAIDGRSWGSSATGLLASALAEQARARRAGGDPGIWDENADLGRQILRGTLTGRGDSPDEAAAKIARFEAAHATWEATPEENATRPNGRPNTRPAGRAHRGRPAGGPTAATGSGTSTPEGQGGGRPGGASRWSLNGANVTFVGGNDVVGQVVGHRTDNHADRHTATGTAGDAGDAGAAGDRARERSGEVLIVRAGDAHIGSHTGGTYIDIPRES